MAASSDLSCCVCLEDYTREKFPTTLTCGHDLCVVCAMAHRKYPALTIACPLCQEVCNTSVEFCKNHRLVEMIKPREVPALKNSCGLHPTREIIAYCGLPKCMKLCAECLNDNRQGSAIVHYIVSPTTPKTKTDNLPAPKHLCQHHLTMEIKFFTGFRPFNWLCSECVKEGRGKNAVVRRLDKVRSTIRSFERNETSAIRGLIYEIQDNAEIRSERTTTSVESVKAGLEFLRADFVEALDSVIGRCTKELHGISVTETQHVIDKMAKLTEIEEKMHSRTETFNALDAAYYTASSTKIDDFAFAIAYSEMPSSTLHDEYYALDYETDLEERVPSIPILCSEVSRAMACRTVKVGSFTDTVYTWGATILDSGVAQTPIIRDSRGNPWIVSFKADRAMSCFCVTATPYNTFRDVPMFSVFLMDINETKPAHRYAASIGKSDRSSIIHRNLMFPREFQQISTLSFNVVIIFGY